MLTPSRPSKAQRAALTLRAGGAHDPLRESFSHARPWTKRPTTSAARRGRGRGPAARRLLALAAPTRDAVRPAVLDRPLPRRAQDRRGRHGHGVRGRGRGPRPPRRHQAPEGGRRVGPAPLLARGARGRAPRHPNVCPLYEVGEDASGPFLAMELMAGEPLSARLRRGPMDVAEVIVARRRYARRAAGDPRRRPGPPRPQAVERLPHAARAAAARLRPGAHAAAGDARHAGDAPRARASTAATRSPTRSC